MAEDLVQKLCTLIYTVVGEFKIHTTTSIIKSDPIVVIDKVAGIMDLEMVMDSHLTIAYEVET